MVAWGASTVVIGLFVFGIIESESNHSYALVIDWAGSESIDDLRSILDLLDFGVGTNVSTLNDLLTIFSIECDLEDVEVSIVESNACHLLILLEFICLSGWLILLTPLRWTSSIWEFKFDGLKSWLLEFIWNRWPLYFLQVKLLKLHFRFFSQLWDIWNALSKVHHIGSVISLLGLELLMVE